MRDFYFLTIIPKQISIKGPMKDFFISRNGADKNWAVWIAWELEEAGFTTVIQDWDFRASSNFVLDMHKAASEAEHTIAVLSSDYLDALYTQPEWAAAFKDDPTGEKGKLIPVRVRECEPEGLLAAIVYIDLVEQEEPAARDVLLKHISGIVEQKRGKPESKPDFPKHDVKDKPRFPGTLPPIWNVPHLRNPNFTGRETILDELNEQLNAGGPTALTAISGLGGIGKTQIALEYAYRHMSNYEVVWWLRTEKPESLMADYAQFAQARDLPEKDSQEQQVIVEAVRRWFGQNRGWLLVFDNAQNPDDIRGYLPRASTGQVLITSRYQSWRGVAKYKFSLHLAGIF